MSRAFQRHVFLSALRVLLVSTAVVAGCSSGGGGGSEARFPPWSTFQHDSARSGISSGGVKNNTGEVTTLFKFGNDATLSTPSIGFNQNIYVGTADGLVAIHNSGVERWRFNGYSRQCLRSPTPCQTDAECNGGDTCGGCALCTLPESGCVRVGGINSSATVSLNGNIVVGTNRGHIFGLQDNGKSVTCRWVARAEDQTLGQVLSSAGTTLNSDSSINSAFLGTNEGFLLALNGNSGTSKWRFPPSGSIGPVTSSPAVALDGSSFFMTADGAVLSVSSIGQLLWRIPVSDGSIDTDFVPSVALGASVYATGVQGTGGVVAAINFSGSIKWIFPTDAPILGSPAIAQQTVNIPVTRTGTPTPSATPTPTAVTDTVVYAVDESGTLYGIRDGTGQVITDPVTIPGSPPAVRSSVALSTDLYAVVVADDGVLYASNLSGSAPCDPCDKGERSNWPVDIGVPIRSSPIIDSNGVIYVIGADGTLYAVGPPPPK